MNRKGLARISQLVLGLLVATSTMAGIITVNGGFADAFEQNLDQDDLDRMEKQKNISDDLNVGKERARQTGSGIESGFFALTQIWNAIKVMFGSIPVANQLIHEAVVLLGLPAWVETLANGLTAAIIVFGVIWLYRGVPP